MRRGHLEGLSFCPHLLFLEFWFGFLSFLHTSLSTLYRCLILLFLFHIFSYRCVCRCGYGEVNIRSLCSRNSFCMSLGSLSLYVYDSAIDARIHIDTQNGRCNSTKERREMQQIRKSRSTAHPSSSPPSTA